MGSMALDITGLTKRYRDFTLDNVAFSVPYGVVVGFIGENGAGKSTTLKAILGLVKKDAGTISILGKQEQDIDFATRNKVGVVFDGNNLPEKLTPKQLGAFLSNIYLSWDKDKYFSMLEQLSLPKSKRIKSLSKGMKMKLAITVALSQNPELLIMDEPTSGLDPVVRDDVLNMIQDFVADHKHSVLLSSHITSDLEKIADTIVFIHQGKIVFCEAKNVLKSQYGIIKCRQTQFAEIDPADILYYRKQSAEWEMLITDRDAIQKKYPGFQINPATIDEIMLICVKGGASMKNMIKAQRYRFTHSGVLWTIIAALFFFALIAILTGSYNSAEAALRSVFRDIAVMLLGSSVYGTIILSEDYSNGLLYHYIAAGYKRASVICAKFVYYLLGCCILLFIYPLLSVTFTAVICGIETSYVSLSLDFIVLFVKSLPLYLGIMGLFFLATILFQKAAIAMAISVALSLFFTGFPSIFHNVSFLKFTPMIQLSSITANSFSVEYLITAILSLCFLGLCLGGSVLKINRDQF